MSEEHSFVGQLSSVTGPEARDEHGGPLECLSSIPPDDLFATSQPLPTSQAIALILISLSWRTIQILTISLTPTG